MFERRPPRIAPARHWAFRPYPQRQVPRMNWVDRTVRYYAGLARTRLRPRRLAQRRLIAAVRAGADGWDGAADLDLLRAAQALRRDLARAGLTRALRVQALALVAAAIERQTGFRLRAVQIFGAGLILDGRMLEMATGEGKSVTALLAAGVAGLAGMNPHMITVNDYLARRDYDSFRPVLGRIGLRGGLVTGDMQPAARALAYAGDVVWVNNKDIAFDYLKDMVAMGRIRASSRQRLRAGFGDAFSDAPPPRPILRGLRFAIVDEADSILVDEAGTPLIISAADGPPPDPDDCLTALAFARRLAAGTHYTVSDEERRVRLTDAGRARTGALCAGLGGLWAIPAAREDRMRQALSALHLFERDSHYIIAPDAETGAPAVVIIDEFTGRAMPDRSWEGGLHQMVEVKEGLPPSGQRRTIARVTYQRFFRQYLRMAGMTGTGMEIAAEMKSFFDLDTIAVPLHRASRRLHLGTELLANAAAKCARIAERARAMQAMGRAVLIGTRTVAASEAVAAALGAAGVAHGVLNARQDAEEAALIGAAGAPGAVTVATNMAGRGTDIVLDPATRAAGGLHVILTEFHESRRIDRQLYGRAGRQGDPGSVEDIVALDDPLFARFAPRLLAVVRHLSAGPAPAAATITRPGAQLLRAVMQHRAERERAALRRLQFEQEHDVARMLAVAGSDR